MATNMPPHNLGEVIAAARHLIRHPGADLETLMRFVPGPDLPTGGRIVGLGGIKDAYAAGRGTFKIRATVAVEDVTARRKGLVVTELPFTVGPEKVIAKIKDLVSAKKLQGIADVKDLTDRAHGLRLVIEVKNGFVPEAVLEQLYKLTPMEESFGINNVALVDGQPLTLGLKELLEVYLDHRFEVVRRRSEFRRTKRRDRLHLVEGLLVALLDIDEVIRLIRDSDNSAQAKERLIERFSLSEIQTQYILDTPLRRLTRFDRIELESERDRLNGEIEELTGDPGVGRGAAQAGLLRTGRGGEEVRHRPAYGAAGVGRRRRSRPCRWRSPTTRAGCCCPRRVCWPVRRTASRSRSPRTARAHEARRDRLGGRRRRRAARWAR